MPAPAWEDLDAFLQPDDFATMAQHRAGGNGAPRPIVGIFEDPVEPARIGGGGGTRRRGEFELDTAVPMFRCKAVDAATVQRLDTLSVDGKVWDVLSVATDGAGMAAIALGARHD